MFGFITNQELTLITTFSTGQRPSEKKLKIKPFVIIQIFFPTLDNNGEKEDKCGMQQLSEFQGYINNDSRHLHYCTHTSSQTVQQKYKLISRISQNTHNHHEDVDDVNVEIQSRENVLFGADGIFVVSSHHHLRVVDEIDAKQQRADTRINQGNNSHLK